MPYSSSGSGSSSSQSQVVRRIGQRQSPAALKRQEELRKKHTAARLIQRTWRVYEVRTRSSRHLRRELREKAARYIQQWWISFVLMKNAQQQYRFILWLRQRARRAKRRWQYAMKAVVAERQQAALIVQRNAMAWLVRRRQDYELRHKSAEAIQKRWRIWMWHKMSGDLQLQALEFATFFRFEGTSRSTLSGAEHSARHSLVRRFQSEFDVLKKLRQREILRRQSMAAEVMDDDAVCRGEELGPTTTNRSSKTREAFMTKALDMSRPVAVSQAGSLPPEYRRPFTTFMDALTLHKASAEPPSLLYAEEVRCWFKRVVMEIEERQRLLREEELARKSMFRAMVGMMDQSVGDERNEFPLTPQRPSTAEKKLRSSVKKSFGATRSFHRERKEDQSWAQHSGQVGCAGENRLHVSMTAQLDEAAQHSSRCDMPRHTHEGDAARSVVTSNSDVRDSVKALHTLDSQQRTPSGDGCVDLPLVLNPTLPQRPMSGRNRRYRPPGVPTWQ